MTEQPKSVSSGQRNNRGCSRELVTRTQTDTPQLQGPKDHHRTLISDDIGAVKVFLSCVDSFFTATSPQSCDAGRCNFSINALCSSLLHPVIFLYKWDDMRWCIYFPPPLEPRFFQNQWNISGTNAITRIDITQLYGPQDLSQATSKSKPPYEVCLYLLLHTIRSSITIHIRHNSSTRRGLCICWPWWDFYFSTFSWLNNPVCLCV